MKLIELTEEEKQIENDIDLLKPVSKKKRKKIENIITEAKKNKSISLRISSHDLEQLKEKAKDEGVPYQTLINSILHKYVTKQFYDKEQMLRSLKLMSKA
jgi:predicted DNA binding CopG/RHH family protein